MNVGYLNLMVATNGCEILIRHNESTHYLNQFPFEFWIETISVDFCKMHDVLSIKFCDASPDDCTRFNLNVRFWPKIQECFLVEFRGKSFCSLCECFEFYDRHFVDNNGFDPH